MEARGLHYCYHPYRLGQDKRKKIYFCNSGAKWYAEFELPGGNKISFSLCDLHKGKYSYVKPGTRLIVTLNAEDYKRLKHEPITYIWQ